MFAVNGVNIDPNKYRLFETTTNLLIRENLKKNIDVNSHFDVKSFHNQSRDLFFDVYETWRLSLKDKESGKDLIPLYEIVKLFTLNLTGNLKKFLDRCELLNVSKQCKDLNARLFLSETLSDLGGMKTAASKALNEGKKILFLSHSAGAIFVDRIRSYIEDHFPSQFKYTSHLALARPIPSPHGKTIDLTLNDDEITNFVRRIPHQNVPEANLFKTKGCVNPVDESDPVVNHDYVFCYLSSDESVRRTLKDNYVLDDRILIPTKEAVLEGLYRAASYLSNNDENCCSKKDGKVWRNFGEYGGFVSSNVKVEGDGDVFIESGAELCGQGVINTSSLSSQYIYSDVKILGKIDLALNFSISHYRDIDKSFLEYKNSNGSLYMNDVQNYGTLKLFIPDSGNMSVNGIFHNTTSLRGSLPFSGEVYGDELDIKGNFQFLSLKTFPSAKVKIESSSSSAIRNTVFNKDGDIKGNLLQIENAIFNDDIFMRAPEIWFRATISGDSSIEAGNSINFSEGNFNNIKVNCTDRFGLRGSNLTQITSNQCTRFSGDVDVRGDLVVSGSTNYSGRILNGGTINGGEGSDIRANVDGFISIDTNKGIDVSNGDVIPGRAEIQGSFMVYENCSSKVNAIFKHPTNTFNINYPAINKSGVFCQNIEGNYDCFYSGQCISGDKI